MPAPNAAPGPPTTNAPNAARTTEVWMSPELVADDAMPAITPRAPAVVAENAPSSSIGSLATHAAVTATRPMHNNVAPSRHESERDLAGVDPRADRDQPGSR